MTIAIPADMEIDTDVVAQLTGLSKARVRKLIREHKIPTLRSGDRGHYRIKFGDIDLVLAADKITPKRGTYQKSEVRQRVEDLEARMTTLQEQVDELVEQFSRPAG